MAVFNDDLYVSGGFPDIGGDTSMRYIAKWSMPVGVEEFEVLAYGRQAKFKVFPNPTKGEVTIELEETLQNKKLQLQVYDNVGKKIMQQSVNNKTTQLATHNLAKGIYHLKLLDESGTVLGVQKFVVE